MNNDKVRAYLLKRKSNPFVANEKVVYKPMCIVRSLIYYFGTYMYIKYLYKYHYILFWSIYPSVYKVYIYI